MYSQESEPKQLENEPAIVSSETKLVMQKNLELIAETNKILDDQLPTHRSIDYEKELQDYFRDKNKFERLKTLEPSAFLKETPEQ